MDHRKFDIRIAICVHRMHDLTNEVRSLYRLQETLIRKGLEPAVPPVQKLIKKKRRYFDLLARAHTRVWDARLNTNKKQRAS